MKDEQLKEQKKIVPFQHAVDYDHLLTLLPVIGDFTKNDIEQNTELQASNHVNQLEEEKKESFNSQSSP